MILRSDIRNQVPETNEANNLKASLDTTRLDMGALNLGVADNGKNTLFLTPAAHQPAGR